MLWIRIAAVSGILAVAAGAFAAHGLEGALSPKRLDNWEVGARYQMYHTLALALVGVLALRGPSRLLTAAGVAFIIGIVIFSGSLYALALSDIGVLGAITPFGGLSMMIGWLLLALAPLRLARREPEQPPR